MRKPLGPGLYCLGGKCRAGRVAREGPAQKPLCFPPAPDKGTERNYLFSKRLRRLAGFHAAGWGPLAHPRPWGASGRRRSSQELTVPLEAEVGTPPTAS